jgi:hypothetical protein
VRGEEKWFSNPIYTALISAINSIDTALVEFGAVGRAGSNGRNCGFKGPSVWSGPDILLLPGP